MATRKSQPQSRRQRAVKATDDLWGRLTTEARRRSVGAVRVSVVALAEAVLEDGVRRLEAGEHIEGVPDA